MDTDSGELVERRLEHESGEARAFYSGLKGAVRVGIEATGHTAWFEAMLAELGHELWMGRCGEDSRSRWCASKKTDARDAAHLLDMLCTNRFPTIWRPSLEERDLRQLFVAPAEAGVDVGRGEEPDCTRWPWAEGVCRKKKLFTAKK